MDSFLKVDVFFFVTTVGVVIVVALAAAALVYALGILRDVRRVTKIIRSEAGEIAKDVSALRTRVKSEGMRLAPAIDFIAKLFNRVPKKRARPAKSRNA